MQINGCSCNSIDEVLAKQKLWPNELLKNSQKSKNQKKREGAYAPPQFVFSDQIALQALHSHNFTCSVEPM